MKTINFKNYIINFNDADGYIPNIIKETNEFYDIGNLNIMKEYLNSDSNVLDIGANIGNHSIFFSQFAKMVYSFEPQIENFNCLEKNIIVNNIKNVQIMHTSLK